MEKQCNGSERLSIGPHLNLVKDQPLFKCKHFLFEYKNLTFQAFTSYHQAYAPARRPCKLQTIMLPRLPPKTNVSCEMPKLLIASILQNLRRVSFLISLKCWTTDWIGCVHRLSRLKTSLVATGHNKNLQVEKNVRWWSIRKAVKVSEWLWWLIYFRRKRPISLFVSESRVNKTLHKINHSVGHLSSRRSASGG